MSMLESSLLPDPSREGRMVAISDGDVRLAPAIEHRLLSTPMSVSAGSKHDNINIIIHSND